MDHQIELKKETKEIQKTIIPPATENGKVGEEEFFSVLRMVAPGTSFRTALEGALKTGKGALIAIENEHLLPLLDGGFRVNCRFTPQRLIELTKMDGAIILSKDYKKINYANVTLTPDSKIKSLETGTRHKAAERTAKQTGTLVIAISERKNEITLFYKNLRYPLKSTNEILYKINHQMGILEKQKELFEKHLEKLNKLELKNYPSLYQAILVIQKGRIIQKIAEEMKKSIIELGSEGVLLKTRLKELLSGVEKEVNLVIKDYTFLNLKKSKNILNTLSYDEILDPQNILKVLAYENPGKHNPIKGWRILSKTSLSEQEISAIIKVAGSLGKAIYSNTSLYSKVIGEEKANIFKQEIERIKLSNY